MKEKKATIILATFNSQKTILNLLKSILYLKYDNLEVIIVDNASTDNTVAIINEILPQLQKKISIKLYFMKTNIGLYAALNLAAEKASGEYLCIIDHDIEMSPFVLEKLVSNLEADRSIGAIQPMIINAYDKRFIDSCDITESGSIRGNEASKYENYKDILYPMGACFVIRKKIFRQVGGFFNDFFVGEQDIDLGWRLWLFGYRVRVVYTVEIYHRRGTLRGEPRKDAQLEYSSFKNYSVMAIQNFEEKNLTKYLLKLVLVPLYELTYNPLSSYYKLKSSVWIVKNIKLILNRRYSIQSRRRIRDDELTKMLKHIFPQPFSNCIQKYLLKKEFKQ